MVDQFKASWHCRTVVLASLFVGVLALTLVASARAASPEWHLHSADPSGPQAFRTSASNLVWELDEPDGTVEVECQQMTGNGTMTSSTEGSESITFAGCETNRHTCTVRSYDEAPGSETIQFRPLSVEAETVSGISYDEITPAAGEVFATVVIEGSGCDVANTYEWKGSIGAEIESLGTEQLSQRLNFSEQIAAEAGTSLRVGKKDMALIGHAIVESAGSPLTGTEASEGSGGEFKLSIPYWRLTMACSSLDETGTISAPREGSADLSFQECDVPYSACEIRSSDQAPGSGIIDTEAATELKVVDGALYDVFSPAYGETETFFTLVIEGSGCSVSGVYEIRGSFAAELEPLGTELVKQPLRFSGVASSAAGAELRMGKKPMTLGGEAETRLSGGHEGEAWGVL